jgi:hypothetical protein
MIDKRNPAAASAAAQEVEPEELFHRTEVLLKAKRNVIKKVISKEVMERNLELEGYYSDLRGLQEMAEDFPTISVVIKGGEAVRAVEIVEFKDRIRPSPYSYPVKDLDIIFFHPRGLGEDRELMIELAEEIQETFPEFKMAENIETWKILKGQDFGQALFESLGARDMSRNEAILTLEDKEMVLYYTEECWKALRERVAFPTLHRSVRRYHYGELVSLALAVVRMIRAAVEDKVDYICLSQQEVDYLWQEAYDQETGISYEPTLPYGITVLCRRYEILENDKEETKRYKAECQKRLMKMLIGMKLTRAKDFKSYRSRLEIQYKMKNREGFVIKERTFREVLEARQKKAAQQTQRQGERKERRKSCSHCDEEGKDLIVQEFLQGKDAGFYREYCPMCKTFHLYDLRAALAGMDKKPALKELERLLTPARRAYPEDLPSNQAIIRGDFSQVPKEHLRSVRELLGEPVMTAI